MKTRSWVKMKLCVLLVLGATGMLTDGCSGGEKYRVEIKNVVLISIDTCRADHLSCYGYRHPVTPNIDALAKQGVRFANAVSPVPMTLPAHCTMLTGTNPLYHGVHDNLDYKLAPDAVTLGEILKNEGFTTGAVVSAIVLDHQFGMDQGFDTYDDQLDPLPATGQPSAERNGEAVNSVGIDWLKQHGGERFFLFLHYYDPHFSYSPPEPFFTKYSSNRYAGEIAYVDFCVGQIISTLKSIGQYESTLIIVTSDHGEMLGEHGEKFHEYFIYQSAVRVPLILRLPGTDDDAAEGSVVRDRVGLVDLVPTICGLLDIEPPKVLHGMDLSPVLRGEPLGPRGKPLYMESLSPTKYGANPLFGIIDGHWKFIHSNRPELYNLKTDPVEITNHARLHTGKVVLLRDKLKKVLVEQYRPDAGQVAVTDAATRRRIESIGYIGGHARNEFSIDPEREDPKNLIDFHADAVKVQMLIDNEELLGGDGFRDVVAICKSMIDRRPDYVKAYLDIAQMAQLKEDFEAAAHWLTRALEHAPDNSVVHCKLGMAIFRLGRTKDAIRRFRKALVLDPYSVVAHFHLAIALHLSDNFEAAIGHYEKAIELDPKRAYLYAHLGAALSAQGETDRAIEVYRYALKLDGESITTHYNLAIALHALGHRDEAWTHFRHVIRINPALGDKIGKEFGVPGD